jgi:hypothetical protein
MHMPLYRIQVAVNCDSTLARDAFVHSLYFNDQGVGSDPDQLCQDLIDVLQAGWYPNPVQMVANAYIVGPPPQYPVGHAEESMGVSPVSTSPREVSICLSYYATRNLPRQRGRLYLPMAGSSFSPSTVRPPVARMQAVLDLAGDFSNIGGIDVDWQVYSPTDGIGRNVTNAWVDDEWDTIRSRGLRPSSRLLVGVDEG